MLSGPMQSLPCISLAWLALAGGLVYASAVSSETPAADEAMLVYIGTYTGARSKGIYVSRFHPLSGELTAPELAAATPNPSFLALHPNQRYLYAVGETAESPGARTGTVCAFRINAADGQLALLNRESSGGAGPCHLAVAGAGKCLLVANYGSGSVAALPLQATGELGKPGTVIQHRGSSVNPQRQAGPHAHFITAAPGDRFALACDLGLDQVLVYRLDPAKAGLVANDPPFAAVKPGAGPRHLAFHPSGRFVFLINEMDSTLAVFAYDARRGALEHVQTVSTLPEAFTGQSTCAGILVHPSGRFVYGSNRGADSIAVFSFDARQGRLKLVEHRPTQGKTPRHIALDPTGQWLLATNQGSDQVVVFRVDLKAGRLRGGGKPATVGAPVCAVFVPGKPPQP